MRVLLVDDHEVVRRGVCSMLAEQWPEAHIEQANDLPPARAALASGQTWDLVVLDVGLPSGSGLELLGDPRLKDRKTPVLVLSAYPDDEFALLAFKSGASGYLSKGSVTSELLMAVQRLLAGGKHVSPHLAERLTDAVSSHRLPHEALSPRELEVLKRVAEGFTIKEIAHSLLLSDKTVATYRARISDKLGFSSNVELARYAVKHRLVA
jgi:two-component system, NarL family, invasion response regulator UvrY